MDFNKNLHCNYNSLTRQGRRIADFIKTSPVKTLSLTVKALGEASGTSAASVVRFCQKLGYKSMEELKIHIAGSLNSAEMSMPLENMASRGGGVNDLGRMLFCDTSKALQGTLDLLDCGELKKTVALLKKARTIYIFGVGASSLAAMDLSHKLNRIGKACVYLLDSHSNLEFASVADKRDAVIAISYSGETKEVYLAAKWAKSNGVPVVSITRNRPSSLSAVSTIVFRLPETEKRVRVGAFSSKYSNMFITDLLYLGFIHKDFNFYEKKLLDTSRIVRGLRE